MYCVHLHSPLFCLLECFVSDTSTNQLSAQLILAPESAVGALQINTCIIVYMYCNIQYTVVYGRVWDIHCTLYMEKSVGYMYIHVFKVISSDSI